MAKCVPGMPCYNNDVIVYTTYPYGCGTTVPSACSLPIASDDLYYAGPNLVYLNVENGEILTTTFQKIDLFFSNFVPIVAGTGISYDPFTGVVTNTAPDQNVTITQGANILVTGSYPNFTVASTGNITIGTTTITSGTSTRVLYNNGSIVGEYSITGTGDVVMSESPTLTGTPILPSTYTIGANSFIRSGAHNLTLTTTGTTTVTLPTTGTLVAVGGANAWTSTNSFIDGNFSIIGSVTSSKIAKFEVDGFTAATTRTFTLPDASGTVALTSALSSWLTGTLTGNATISTGSAGDILFNDPSNTKGFSIGSFGNEFLSFYSNAAVINLTAGTSFYAGAGSIALDIQTTGMSIVGGKLSTIAGTTSNAPLNIPQGVAPTTPVNGDIWTTSTSAYARINGSTIDLGAAGGGGSIATLSDVTLTSLATNQYLKYNGSAWVNTYSGNPIKQVATSTYTIDVTDWNKTIEFTVACTVDLPNGLPTDFICTLIKYGTGDILLSPATTLYAVDDTITVQYTGAVVYHRGSNVWVATGALGTSGGGITNTAANTELMMSNGTNAVPSGIFSASAGSIELGTGLTGATRTITATGSGSNVDLILATKGSGALVTPAIINLGTASISGDRSFTAYSSDASSTIAFVPKGSGVMQVLSDLYLGNSGFGGAGRKIIADGVSSSVNLTFKTKGSSAPFYFETTSGNALLTPAGSATSFVIQGVGTTPIATISSSSTNGGLQIQSYTASSGDIDLSPSAAGTYKLRLSGSSPSALAGGDIDIRGGSPTGGNNNAGSVNIFSGTPSGSGAEFGVNIQTRATGKVGFFNATAVVQQSVNTILVNNVTSGGTLSTIADFTSLTVYSTDAAAIRNNFFRLTEKVLKLETAVRNYGIVID